MSERATATAAAHLAGGTIGHGETAGLPATPPSIDRFHTRDGYGYGL